MEFCDRLGDVCCGESGIKTVEPCLRLIGVEFRQADDGGSGGLLLLIVRGHAWFGVWLRVKSVTSVAEAYTTRPNKEKTGKVLYSIFESVANGKCE